MRQNRSRDKSQASDQDYSDVLELVEQLAEILDRTDLSEVRIRDEEFEVQVSRYSGASGGYAQPPTIQPVARNVAVEAPQLPVETTEVVSSAQPEGDFIKAPMPSRFYRSPSPDEPPFVNVGDRVAAGQPVAVLEVMKTYNQVEAPFNCEILEILVEDGEAVEYDAPLFRVKQG